MALTVVWSVFERTQFWMEPGFTLFAYENFFTSARAENYVLSMSAFRGRGGHLLPASVSPSPSSCAGACTQVAQHRVILLFILPFMISELIRIFALRPVLGRTGLVNTALMEVGIISEPISAILFTPLGVIIGDVLSFLPFMMFAGFLALEAVQNYIFEVCDDLGTGRVRHLHRHHPAAGGARHIRRQCVHLRQRHGRGAGPHADPRRSGRGQCGTDRQPGHRRARFPAGHGD